MTVGRGDALPLWLNSEDTLSAEVLAVLYKSCQIPRAMRWQVVERQGRWRRRSKGRMEVEA